MNERKSTPGPWKCERLIDDTGVPYATHYQAHIDLGVCMVWAPPGHAEQEANAILLAAAPELAEALRDSLDEWVPRTERQLRRYEMFDELLKRVGY